MNLERAAVPVVLVCTAPFAEMARATMNSLGAPHLRLVVLDHPLGHLDPHAVQEMAAAAAGDLVAAVDGGAFGGPAD